MDIYRLKGFQTMHKSWLFMLSEHKIKVSNSWFTGLKLYIDDELKDKNKHLFSAGNMPLLSANIAGAGLIEICPKSSFFSTEIDAYFIENNEEAGVKQIRKVFSSYQRLSLKEQRLIKELG